MLLKLFLIKFISNSEIVKTKSNIIFEIITTKVSFFLIIKAIIENNIGVNPKTNIRKSDIDCLVSVIMIIPIMKQNIKKHRQNKL